ncbi:MAG: transglutaminase family protein [Verrucomicrobiota bacterium]
MRLHVTHRTRFTYAEPVKDSFNEVRLKPTSSGGQTCESFHLRILPPANVSEYIDLYRNCVHLFDVSRAHRELSITATSIVDTRDTPASPELDATPAPLSGMGACARTELCHDFLQSSAYVETSPELWRLALDIVQGIPDAWQASLAIMRHIHREFRYQPDSTHVNTRATDALLTRTGVCQDFTHVMIGLCRALKIPARYVSGYLYNGPADQLKGAQASHAWVEVYIPTFGWCGLDPTNNQRPDGRYVKIGAGRDYSDVSPTRGTYRGTTERTMTVDVLVSTSAPAAISDATSASVSA